MPIYEFECPDGDVSELISSIGNRPKRVMCSCGQWAARIISRPVVQGDLEHHLDENLAAQGDGEPFLVKGRKQKEQRLRELGLAVQEPSYESRARRLKGTIYSR